MALTISQEYLEEIRKWLNLIYSQIKGSASLGLFSDAKQSEDFFAELYNVMYDASFVNLNAIKTNFPAIDIADITMRKSVQITIDGTTDKVKETIKKFEEAGLKSSYDELEILCITYDKMTSAKIPPYVSLKNLTSVIQEISKFDDKKLKKIRIFLTKTLRPLVSRFTNTIYTELDIIINVVEWMSEQASNITEIESPPDMKKKEEEILKEYASELKQSYKDMCPLYEGLVKKAEDSIAKDKIKLTKMNTYLQTESRSLLSKHNHDPKKAVEELIETLCNGASQKGVICDKQAIRYFIINKIFDCFVFKV